MSNFDLYQNRLQDSRKISRSRLVDTKVKTFKRALDSSYNSTTVISNDSEFQALITGIPTSPKISKKHFATLEENGVEVGDYIYWPDNDSHWLVSEHDSTETSIFQGSMQKTLYELKWQDPRLDKIYSARAAVKGPDETTIGDGVKHAIQFDTFTDSLYLIISAKVPGAHLLKRYFEIMVNGKKWSIQVADNFTDPALIFLQLLEVAFDRDADTGEVVGGQNPNVYTVQSVLDGVTSVALNTVITFDPILSRNGSVVPDERVKINTVNCTLLGNQLSFGELGLCSVTVKYEDYNKIFTWKLEVLDETVDSVETQEIWGSENVKTFSTNNYMAINIVNGVPVFSTGVWTYDKNYFELSAGSTTEDTIVLKAKNKTGTTEIKYATAEVTLVKIVKIIPMFGGS